VFKKSLIGRINFGAGGAVDFRVDQSCAASSDGQRAQRGASLAHTPTASPAHTPTAKRQGSSSNRQKASAAARQAQGGVEAARDHFRLLATSRKVVLRRVPKLVNAVMIAIAMSDAIRAYSMAVALDSLAKRCDRS
jgi:hypothetical protein